MSKKIVMDTDILSGFAAINRLDDLVNLFPDQIIVPDIVLGELEALKYQKKYSYIYNDVLKKIEDQELELFEILNGSKEFKAFMHLTTLETGQLGEGEAACLAIAMTNDRIISSSNLRDVNRFVNLKLVENIPTIEILKRLHTDKGYSLEDVDGMKNKMILKGRKLPPGSIADFL